MTNEREVAYDEAAGWLVVLVAVCEAGACNNRANENRWTLTLELLLKAQMMQ